MIPSKIKATSTGPPLAPEPFLEVVNATAIKISWEKPFSWEGWEVLSYNISWGSNSMSTKEQSVVLENELAEACIEIEFNVSAMNAVGQSDVRSIHGSFPIGKNKNFCSLSFNLSLLSISTWGFYITYLCRNFK